MTAYVGWLNLIDPMLFHPKTEDWCFELSTFFDPYADEPPADPIWDVLRNYPGRNVVSKPVSQLMDSWLDKVLAGRLDDNETVYENSDRHWCTVAHMKELVLNKPC